MTPAQSRILVIGNSITLGTGSTSGTGWRQLLLDSLSTLGYVNEWVGPSGNDPIRGHFYPGQSIGAFYTGPGGTGTRDVAPSMNLYQPHIVVVHLGSNDIGGTDDIGPYSDDGGVSFNTQRVGGRLAQFIAYLLQWKNGTRGTFLREIYVCAVIPRIDIINDGRNPALGFYYTVVNIYSDAQNNRIPAIPRNSFRFVDQYHSIDPQTMLNADGLHPNDTGYSRMAKTFFGTLRGLAMLYDKTAGDGQRGRPGETLPQPLTVRVRNGYGSLLNNQPVFFEVVSGDAVFTDSQNPVLTTNGIASKSVRILSEGAVVIGATVHSTINRTLFFHVYGQDRIHVTGDVFYDAQDIRPVPNVRIEWVESGVPIDTTSPAGRFASTKIPFDEDFSIRPLKTPNEDVTENAILSYDAALVARHAVGLNLLDAASKIAADVNQDGKADLGDAIQIARYAVGYSPPTGVLTGAWTFTPSRQSFTTPGDTVRCDVFRARLIGDVSAGWRDPSVPKTGGWHVKSSARVWDDSLCVTLTVTGGGFLSADARIVYDPSGIRFLSAEKGEGLDGFQMLSHTPRPGEIRLGLFGAEERDNPVTAAWIFRHEGIPPDATVQILNLYVNDTAFPEQRIALNPDSSPALPDRPMLYANYPNPFNPGTTIPFALHRTDRVRLVILNAVGQAVRILEAGEMPAGRHELPWDGRTDSGQAAPSGVYVIRLETTETQVVRKINLIR